MSDISAQELIEFLMGKPKSLEYSISEVSCVLKTAAEAGDVETFGKVVDTYVNFKVRALGKNNAGITAQVQINALEYMARCAAVADLGLRQSLKAEDRIEVLYQTPNRHGPAMNAFMKHSGWNGEEIASMLLKTKGSEPLPSSSYTLN